MYKYFIISLLGCAPFWVQQFLLWKMEIRWENGLGGSGGLKRIFWDPNARISSKTVKKNPFESAQSAQSVLPSYLPFPNEKLLDCGLRIAECVDYQWVPQSNRFLFELGMKAFQGIKGRNGLI